jgi:hypothetical protein
LITFAGHAQILAPFDSSNTDGVDIDSTTNVLVEDLYCYNGGDSRGRYTRVYAHLLVLYGESQME